MKRASIALGLTVLLATSAAAMALEVKKSVEVAADPAKVWQTIGDFCGIANWHPALAKCEPSDKDGAKMRLLTLKDGGKIFEKQTAWDDKGMSYSYAIIDAGPLPVANYESTLAVTPNGSGSTVTWSGKFDAAKGSDDAKATDAIGGVYQGGLDAIAAKVK